jgi:hypothetical protein
LTESFKPTSKFFATSAKNASTLKLSLNLQESQNKQKSLQAQIVTWVFPSTKGRVLCPSTEDMNFEVLLDPCASQDKRFKLLFALNEKGTQ